MKTSSPIRFVPALRMLAVAAALAAVAACGGNEDPPALSIAGTAATGAAIANASVTATCKQGTGTATTNRDGSFTVRIAAPGQGPCIISVTSGTSVLRSITAGEGRANVTPLTEMLVAFIAVQSGAGANATPQVLANNSNVATVVTTPAVLAASVAQLSDVVQAAAGTGVSIPGDFLTGVLVPKDTSNAGNAQDQVLELLKARGVITAAGTVAPNVVAAALARASKFVVTGGQTGGQ